jgi:hypothetical protein
LRTIEPGARQTWGGFDHRLSGKINPRAKAEQHRSAWRWTHSNGRHQDIRRRDIGAFCAESRGTPLLRNPHVAQIRLDLPDADDRAAYQHELDLARRSRRNRARCAYFRANLLRSANSSPRR